MSKEIRIKNKIESEKYIQISPFKKEIRKTHPHKHNNYFEIIYLTKGKGFHTIDSLKYNLAPPVIFFIRKEQVHYWELTAEPEGYVIIITNSFIDRSLDADLKSLLARLSEFSCLNLPADKTLPSLFNLLAAENDKENEDIFHVREGLLKALFAKLLSVSEPARIQSHVKSDMYHSFLELLIREKIVKNNVAYYAGLLNTTPQNLNILCRKSVQKSAAEVMAEFIINEGKRLLLYTDNTISEISYELGFKDPSHFIKYFKRKTRQTPKYFRLSGL